MYQLKRTIRFLGLVITAPIWGPWVLLKRFGRRLWKMAKGTWKGGVWTARKLWKLSIWFLTTFYWKPFKFVFKTVPVWIYKTILTPIGHMIDGLNTLVAHGVYRVLLPWTQPREDLELDQEEDIPAPQLEAETFAHCQMCQMETAHTAERISGDAMDTLETCKRCGARQAGHWDTDHMPLLEYAA